MIDGKLYSEILDEFQKAQTKQERIAVLKKYDHKNFREFLFYALEPTIEFDVEVPNYRPAPEPAGLNYTYLDLEVKKLYRFIKDHKLRPAGLTPQKQKQLLVVVLESLYKDEAELLVKVVQKKFKIPNLTIKLVQEAYPGM
jgi:hypothetical protein